MDQKAWGLWMLGSEVATAYRLNAANCVEMAKEFPKAEERIAFLKIKPNTRRDAADRDIRSGEINQPDDSEHDD